MVKHIKNFGRGLIVVGVTLLIATIAAILVFAALPLRRYQEKETL